MWFLPFWRDSQFQTHWSTILPPPCFTVEAVFSGLYASPLFLQTASLWLKSFSFVSSVLRMHFPHHTSLWPEVMSSAEVEFFLFHSLAVHSCADFWTVIFETTVLDLDKPFIRVLAVVLWSLDTPLTNLFSKYFAFYHCQICSGRWGSLYNSW